MISIARTFGRARERAGREGRAQGVGGARGPAASRPTTELTMCITWL